MKKFFTLFTAALLATSLFAASYSVKYTVATTRSVSTTGTAPTGSSASYTQTYSTACQMTGGNSETLTLKNLGKINITNLTLSMKSNKSGGGGSLAYSVDGGANYTYLVGTSSSGVGFNQDAWNGAWSTDYVNISKDVTINNVDSLIIKINATSNSLYCQSFTLTYDASPWVSASVESVDFGTVKQHTLGDNNTEYLSKTVTLKGAFLNGSVTLSALGAIFSVNPTVITPDAKGAINQEVTIYAATGWSGKQDNIVNVESNAEPADFELFKLLDLKMNVTPTWAVSVAANNDEYGTATINGEASVYVDANDIPELIAVPAFGCEFVNWSVAAEDAEKVTFDDATNDTTTIIASEAVAITANFKKLTNPILELTPDALDFGSVVINSDPVAKTFSLSAVNLTGEKLTITVDGDQAFTVSPSEVAITAGAANATITVTPITSAAGEKVADIVVSDGTTSKSVLAGINVLQTYTVNWFINGEKKGTQTAVAGTTLENIPETEGGILDKVFVGWAEAAIVGTTDEAPEIFQPTVMPAADKDYYAVYAIKVGGGEELAQTLEYDTWSYTGSTTDKTTYRLFGSGAYVESEAFDLSLLTKVVVYGGTFGGTSYNSLTIGDGTNTWKSVTVSGSSQTGKNTYTNGTALSGNAALRVTSNSGDGSANGVRISAVEIYVTLPLVYSAYATSGAHLLANPTFVPVAGEYEGEQTIAITTTDANAKIYYTINGGNPTADSTEYTEPIVLNKWGNYTIKAIAIEGENHSEVVSATYKLTNIPFASLEELVETLGTKATNNITVTLTKEEITKFSTNRKGVFVDVADPTSAGNDIQIYCSTVAPEAWEVSGTISGTITGNWLKYNSTWEIEITSWEDITYDGPATSLSNTAAESKAVKTIVNGQLLITRDGKTYNVLGTLVR